MRLPGRPVNLPARSAGKLEWTVEPSKLFRATERVTALVTATGPGGLRDQLQIVLFGKKPDE